MAEPDNNREEDTGAEDQDANSESKREHVDKSDMASSHVQPKESTTKHDQSEAGSINHNLDITSQKPPEKSPQDDTKQLLTSILHAIRLLEFTSHATPSITSSAIEREVAISYRAFANASLAAAAFAGTISLTVILTPGLLPSAPGVNLLAYASALFVGCIMACICLIASIETRLPFSALRLEATAIGAILITAFFLLLLASTLFRGYTGPFVLGCVLYCSFGVGIGVIGLLDYLPVRMPPRMGRAVFSREI